MTENAVKILYQVYMNVILGVIPCDPENEDARKEVFADYIADTIIAMINAGDISAVDAFYATAEICPLIWRTKKEGEEKKDAP